jgi:hypothetical protein
MPKVLCCMKSFESGGTDAETSREAELQCAVQVNEAHDDAKNYNSQVASKFEVGRLCL